MENIIILITFIVVLLIYMDYFKNKNIEKLKIKTVDPTQPEKCFFDFELKELHGIFVNALGNDIVGLKKIKGKLLPSVCILDMIINKKVGWDKYLDSLGTKYGFSIRKISALIYLKEEYDALVKYAKENGFDFLTKPSEIEVPFNPKRYKAGSTTEEETDPVTGRIAMDKKTIDVLKEFRERILAKLEREATFN
jgi:hypothetical protein